MLRITEAELIDDFNQLGIEIGVPSLEGVTMNLQIQSTLQEEIIQAQRTDESMQRIRNEIYLGKAPRFQGRLCVPNHSELKRRIMEKGTKMYQDLRSKLGFTILPAGRRHLRHPPPPPPPSPPIRPLSFSPSNAPQIQFSQHQLTPQTLTPKSPTLFHHIRNDLIHRLLASLMAVDEPAKHPVR
ncbi:hypothetical protein Droror1_Dr00010950 [Drosera rotundifolia]